MAKKESEIPESKEVGTIEERTFIVSSSHRADFTVNGRTYWFIDGRHTTTNPDVIQFLSENGFNEANVKV